MNFKKIFLSIAVPTLIGFFGVTLSAWSATTIGTDISTTGTLTASTTAAGADITLKASDELIFNGAESAITVEDIFEIDLGTFPGGTAGFLMDDGGIVVIEGAESGGAQFFSAEFAPSGISVGVGGGSSELSISDADLDINAVTAIDAGGGADEVSVAAGVTTFLGSIKLPVAATPPAACAAGTVAQVYFDTTINEPCYCNATAWTAFDGAGSCS